MGLDRIVGIETEYGCLVGEGQTRAAGAESWPVRIKNHLFKKLELGAIDLHYRDYEEPPGNGGFLLNGGRLYIDMGHLEYSSPECVSVRDIAAYDRAGERMIQRAVGELKAARQVSFIKNNIDHYTGATFGCHENYLMRRDPPFSAQAIRTLLAFLVTRQVFSGSGRVGQATPPMLEFETPRERESVDFQISQRADHIVNDIYQWVQFNRAIINARDEPLADFRKYRRLHLLIGDSNMSPFATALKTGTTALVLSLLEERKLPKNVILRDPVTAMRSISRKATGRGTVPLEDGRTRDALDIQYEFHDQANQHLRGTDPEVNWVLDSWRLTLDALSNRPESLIGGVDWISKKWLLERFLESEHLSWRDPWLQSIDLAYHDIDPAKGLFFRLRPMKRIAEFNTRAGEGEAFRIPPSDTRARGRGRAVAYFQRHETSYFINWDSISFEHQNHLPMPDPFDPYEERVAEFLSGVRSEPEGTSGKASGKRGSR